MRVYRSEEESDRRIRELRARGCEVTVREVPEGRVVLKRCPATELEKWGLLLAPIGVVFGLIAVSKAMKD
jgi:hypothetical protein